MTGSDPLIASLERALLESLNDVTLRLHLASLLIDAGGAAGALQHCGHVLAVDPTNVGAQELLGRAAAALAGAPPTPGFDWTVAEEQVADVVPRMFVSEDSGIDDPDIERPTLTLADVAGMAEVKERLEAAFLLPLRNEELALALAGLDGALFDVRPRQTKGALSSHRVVTREGEVPSRVHLAVHGALRFLLAPLDLLYGAAQRSDSRLLHDRLVGTTCVSVRPSNVYDGPGLTGR